MKGPGERGGGTRSAAARRSSTTGAVVLGEHRASARGKGEGSLISVREACIRSGFNHSVCWCWDEIGSEEGGGLGDEKWVVHILPTHPKKMMMRDTKPGWHTARRS